MADIYSLYETGLQRLLKLLGPQHPRYADALLYQQRLGENLHGARRYGDSESRRAERAEILDRLNALALEELGRSFNELSQEPTGDRPSPRPSRSGERGVAVGGDVVGSTIITGDHNVIMTGKEPSQPPAVDDRAGLERALEMARRALALLETKAAGYTALTIPINLQIDLEEKRKEVAELEARLAGTSGKTTPPHEPVSPPPAKGHAIFLSYSRRDSDWMRRIQADLAKEGLPAWVDETNLEPGTPAWETAIAEAIDAAGAVVVLLSPEAKKSVWVARELGYAEEHGKRIFPILVRGEGQDAVPIRLVSTQRVDARGDKYAAAMKQLVAALKKHLA